MPVVGGAATLGGLLIAWVRGKEGHYRELVAHYNEMATKVYPVIRRKLEACRDPVTFLLGLQDSGILGGGPVSAWWPALQETEPGLIHHLNGDLRAKLDELTRLAAVHDKEKHESFRLCWGLLASACEPARHQHGIEPDEMPTINVSPSGYSGAAMQDLWARGETMEAWLNRTAPYRSGKPVHVDIHMSGRVVAREREAYEIIRNALQATEVHERLAPIKKRARDAAQVAAEALELLVQEEQTKPRRRFLWPRLDAEP